MNLSNLICFAKNYGILRKSPDSGSIIRIQEKNTDTAFVTHYFLYIYEANLKWSKPEQDAKQLRDNGVKCIKQSTFFSYL